MAKGKMGMFVGGHDKEPKSAHRGKYGRGKAPAKHSHSKRAGGKRSM